MNEWNGNIKPVHNGFQDVGSGSTHDDFVSDYDDSSKAFQDFDDVGSTSTHDAFGESGYQYVLNEPQQIDEQAPILDEVQTTVRVSIEELIDVLDYASPPGNPIPEASPITDSVKTTVRIQIEELIGSNDSARAVETFSEISTCFIKVNQYFANKDSTKIQISAYQNEISTTNISILENNLVGVTSASSASNPFLPTVYCNGTFLVQNASTVPSGSLSNTSIFVKYLNAGVTGIDLCDLQSFSLELDDSGGNFSIASTELVGNVEDTVTIFGFRGTITASGPEVSDSLDGYKQSGIFGNRNLNRQITYLLFGNTAYNQIIPNQTLQVPSTLLWRTVSDAARAIGQAAGVGIAWATKDLALGDFTPQSGQTALDALSSLAGRVGGRLLWNGDQSYIVAYPDFHRGYWEVPDCCLITSSGISYANLIDWSRLSSAVAVVPSFPTFDAGKKTLPGSTANDGAGPQVKKFFETTKLLTSDDPPLVEDLPQDYDKVYIQILIPEGQGTGGANQVSLNNFVTNNPKEWFELNVGAFNSEYVFITNIGGARIPQVKVDYRLFPDNDAVDAGNFVLSLAYTTRTQEVNDAFNKQKQQAADQIRDTLAQQQESYRFVKTYEGTINCLFFGSIPLPGMWAKATVGDTIVEGIVERVGFSFPGILSVTVARYRRITFIQPKSQI